MTRFGLVALVLTVGLIGVARAEDKKEAPKTETVDFRKLKEIMPTELNGLKRSECNGERNKFGEVSISQVSATYKKGDDEKAPKVDVQVIDYSNPDMAKGMSAAWSTVEIDKESDDGFQKTVKIKGNPGYLAWTKEGGHGEVNMLVGGRYVVTMSTENVASGDVIKMAEALPLDKLAALK